MYNKKLLHHSKLIRPVVDLLLHTTLSNMQTYTGEQLAEYIISIGTVVGPGQYKGSVTISVAPRPKNEESDALPELVDFCIGRKQGIKLIQNIITTSHDDPLNKQESKVQYSLYLEDKNAMYTIVKTRTNWYEVDRVTATPEPVYISLDDHI